MGRFQVISAKIARQVSERFAAETGWLVLDQTGRIVYRMRRRAEAAEACARLNAADR